MAKRNLYDEELDAIIAQVTEAKRKATQREQNMQREISRLNLRLEGLKEEEELAREILGDKASGPENPPARAPAPATPECAPAVPAAVAVPAPAPAPGEEKKAAAPAALPPPAPAAPSPADPAPPKPVAGALPPAKTD